MDRSPTRRRLLGTGAALLAAGAGAGCQTLRGEDGPGSLAVAVENDRDVPVTVVVTVEDGGETVFEESFDVAANGALSQDVEFVGTEFDVDLVVRPEDGDAVPHSKSWVWGGCPEAEIAVYVSEDLVSVGDGCVDE